MARAHFVKAAAKDNPVAKKGESYYWWKPRYGSKRYSKTPPRPSQLTSSDFLSRQMELEERISDLQGHSTFDELKSDVEDIVMEIRSLGEEQEDRLSNMPDSLQQSPTGELLEGRASACEEWASDLEGVDLDIDEPTDSDAEGEIDPCPALEDVSPEDLNEGETAEQHLEMVVGEWEQEKADKLEELQEEYRDKLNEAVEELQGITYQGE